MSEPLPSPGQRFAEYAAVLVLLVSGALGSIHFGGLVTLTIQFAAGSLLLAFGLFTLTSVARYLPRLTKATRNFYLVWGYIPSAIGTGLVLSPVLNFFLGLSLGVLGLALVALLILRL